MWNEVLGWACVMAGMLTGALAGLRFQSEAWLGGYSSHRRRLLRLGHVALMALGILNVLFVQGLERMSLAPAALSCCAWAWAVGALAMPTACALAAFGRRSPLVFVLPVTSLLLAVALTLWGLATRLLEVS